MLASLKRITSCQTAKNANKQSYSSNEPACLNNSLGVRKSEVEKLLSTGTINLKIKVKNGRLENDESIEERPSILGGRSVYKREE
jgi:hypothetical protein